MNEEAQKRYVEDKRLKALMVRFLPFIDLSTVFSSFQDYILLMNRLHLWI